MKLVTYYYQEKDEVGAVVDNHIIPAGRPYHGQMAMAKFLQAGDLAKEALAQKIIREDGPIPLDKVMLRAPIPCPNKFFGVSLNYADHIIETEIKQPEYPTFFNKQSTCVIGHNMPICRPKVSNKLDYEGELALVLGKKCRNISKAQAIDAIAGYTIVNDISVRDWQMRSHTWTLGKSFDTHGPMGPWIVTSDEILNPHTLDLQTWVNDEKRQHSNTRELIFDCYDLVHYLAQVMTLLPGDVIATGTPAGVGVKMTPRGYLQLGDVVRIQITEIGTLENPVIEEPEGHIIFE